LAPYLHHLEGPGAANDGKNSSGASNDQSPAIRQVKYFTNPQEMTQHFLMGLGIQKAENICIDVGNRTIGQIKLNDKPMTEEELFN